MSNYTFTADSLLIQIEAINPVEEKELFEFLSSKNISLLYPSYVEPIDASIYCIQLNNMNYLLIFNTILYVDHKLVEHSDLKEVLGEIKVNIEKYISEYLESQSNFHKVIQL